LKRLDQLAAAILQHRAQDARQDEDLGSLRQCDDVVHDHRRLMAVQIGELEGLVVDQDQHGLLRGQEGVQAGLAGYGLGHRGYSGLANLEFVRSAKTKSFSAAAWRLSLTPAAVSRNVATLERNLGVRLFQRSTRKLTLTEAGERFLHAIQNNLDELQAAIASIATDRGEPAGVLKVSMGMTFIHPDAAA
jgi:DNA-binding MarR family transcriptional regulator